MRVVRIPEREVADVVRAVHGLAQGPQQHRLNQARVGALLHCLDELGIMLRLRLVTAAEGEPHLGQEFAQVAQFFRRRSFVNAIRRRDLVFPQDFRGADIGREHALLDQAVRIVALQGKNALDLAVRVEQDARLRQFEIHRAALHARRVQYLVKAVQRFQVRHDIGVLAPQRRVLIHQHGRYLGVGEARARAHGRFQKPVFEYLAAAVDLHLAGHAQTIHVRIDGAQAVGQRLRQHRNDMLWEINRVAARVGLAVQRRAGLDIIRHVGDRHDQPPCTSRVLGKNGVVEITRVLAINGHERYVAQIEAPLGGLRRHLGRELFRLARHGVRPDMGNVMRPDRHLDFHARRHMIAQHLDDAPGRRRAARR